VITVPYTMAKLSTSFPSEVSTGVDNGNVSSPPATSSMRIRMIIHAKQDLRCLTYEKIPEQVGWSRSISWTTASR
jgi:hypothetical protein